MKNIQLVFFLLGIFYLSNCKISENQIVGIYHNTYFGDTLKINSDKSYEYQEKLNSGKTGWTKGQWKISGRKIHFYCDHNPLVGYKMKVKVDTLLNKFQIRILLNDSEIPVYINQVNIFSGGTVLNDNNYSISKNIVQVFSDNFDSIVIKNINLVEITFPDTLNINNAYIARIYPVERLYELDKVPFKAYKNGLSSTKTKEFKNVSLFLERIKN